MIAMMKFTEYHWWTLQTHALYPSSKHQKRRGDALKEMGVNVWGLRHDTLHPGPPKALDGGPSLSVHPINTYP